MLAVAIKTEVDQARMQFAAVSAAIAGSFAKNGAKPFLDSLDKVDREATSARAQKPKESPAKQMLSVFQKLGLNVKGLKR